MGQYWIIVNVTKKQWIDCYEFGVSKMMEFSWIGNPYILSIEAAISPGGVWYGDAVWFEGDYNDINQEINNEMNLYHLARESWECVSIAGLGKNHRYVINKTKSLFIDITKSKKDQYGYRLHPMPILLANSTGGGGGDYKGANEHHLGRWVEDLVSTSDERPTDYTELDWDFNDD